MRRTAPSLPKSFSKLVLVWLGLLVWSFASTSAQTVVQKNGERVILIRNGSPYYIRGVGGTVNLDLAVQIGANSIRTWGIDDAQRILDDAQAHGLTVMLGLWLQHERHGFDYDDTAAVRKQFDHFKDVVEKFKSHPALLMWGVGNEVDLNYTNPNVWYAVQQIARYIHLSDPNHPTSTVIAGLDSMDVAYIKQRVTDIDVLGINTYGDIGHVPTDIRRFGWNGPYMITEWGVNGYWESPQTSWKVSIEQTSSEKKKVFYDRYKQFIEPFPDCLGSYAFLWGAKQEYTETWFGLFTKENEPTEPVDALEMLFLQKDPSSPSPTLDSMTLDFRKATDNIVLKAGTRYEAQVVAAIAQNMTLKSVDTTGALTYEWKVLQESEDKKSGGDREAEAVRLRVRFRHAHQPAVSLVAPEQEGSYRLFVKVSGFGKVAYGNIPFQIVKRSAEDGPAHFVSFKRQTMEFSR